MWLGGKELALQASDPGFHSQCQRERERGTEKEEEELDGEEVAIAAKALEMVTE